MLDFAALPPEINSARMYSGPGPGPMLAAASAWNTMAAELHSSAASYHSVLTELTATGWTGPSSTSMLAAATPYLAWLNSTAAQAEQAGSQAFSAATAFESAFSATVPPPVVAANRAQLATLVATNVIGQNTPAIAATEAHYTEMWAQDAAAMNGYASASSTATQLTPLTAPQSTTNPGGAATQATAVAHAAATPAASASSATSGATSSATSGATSSATSSSSGLAAVLGDTNNSALGNFLNSNFFSGTVVNGALAGGPFSPEFIMESVTGFSFLMAAKGGGLLPGLGGMFGSGGLGGLGGLGLVGASGAAPAGIGSAASAGMGHASLVGALSVPPGWTPATTISPAEAASPVTGLGDIGSSPAGGPGGLAAPLGGMGGRLRRAVPKYGFRPVVMPRPPAAG